MRRPGAVIEWMREPYRRPVGFAEGLRFRYTPSALFSHYLRMIAHFFAMNLFLSAE